MNVSESNNNNDINISMFLNDSDSDPDIDFQNAENQTLRSNENKIQRLNQRLLDCIVHLVKIFACYSQSCREGGVLSCGIKVNQNNNSRD